LLEAVNHIASLIPTATLREDLIGASTWTPTICPSFCVRTANCCASPAKSSSPAASGWAADDGTKLYDVAIVGAGPAGLAAAVMRPPKDCRFIVLDCHAFGGQAGAPRASKLSRSQRPFGLALMARAYNQAQEVRGGNGDTGRSDAVGEAADETGSTTG